MNQLATDTMERMLRGDARGIRLREDTITETNLLELDLRHPEIIVHRFNQHEERAVGADWEWFIGSDKVGWFGLRIQAKRLDGGQYRQLGHPGLDPDDFQYDTLINSCAADTADGFTFFPHYVFFNGLESWPAGAAWTGCPNRRAIDACSHAGLGDFGCSTAPAQLVRRIHAGRGVAGRRLDPHLSVQVPWSWLFGMNGGARPSTSVSGGPWEPSRFSTRDILAWHQAQSRLLGAIAARDTLDAELSSGRANEPREGLGIPLDLPSGDSMMIEFWREVDRSSSEADLSDLAPLPSYAAFARAQSQRPDPDRVELEELDSLAFEPIGRELPRHVVIVDMAQFDG